MPLDGLGTYTPPAPEFPGIPNTVIASSDYNTILNDLSVGLSTALFRDGQAQATANIGWGTFKLYNLGNGTADADAVNYKQVFKNPTFTSNVDGAPNGVIIAGTRFSINTTEVRVTSADVQFSGATNLFGGTLLDINSTTVDIDCTTFDVNTTGNIVLGAAGTLAATITGAATITAASTTFVGAVTATMASASVATTQATTDDSTKLATTAFVTQKAFATALPAMTGNAGKLVQTDGATASWSALLDTSVVVPIVGTALATTTGTQTLTNKTTQAPIWQDSADTTKKANVILSGITAGQNRNITLADENMALFTPGIRLLSVVNASNSATVDIESTFDSTYDNYLLVVDGLTVQTDLTSLRIRFKLSGAYVTTGTYFGIATGVATISTGTEGTLRNGISNLSTNAIAFQLMLSNPTSVAFKKAVTFRGYDAGGTSAPQIDGVMTNSGVGALTGIRFYTASGNIVAGSFKLYGMRKV